MTKISNQSPSFKMALCMPSKAKLIKKVGTYAANEAERARPVLQELAQDVDMTVKPYSFYNTLFCRDKSTYAFKVTVHKIMEKPKNSIMNFLVNTVLYKTGIIKPPYAERGSRFITAENLSESIINTAKNAKADFKKLSLTSDAQFLQ